MRTLLVEDRKAGAQRRRGNRPDPKARVKNFIVFSAMGTY